MDKFYDKPTQVIFTDEEGNRLGGIAYHDIIICGECGGILEYDSATIIQELSWVDISNAIGGDELQ